LIRRAGDVVHRTIGNEAFLLDLASGRYFGLNRTGAVFWEALGPEGATFESVEEALLRTFDVPTTELHRDLSDLVAKLTALGLVSVQGP